MTGEVEHLFGGLLPLDSLFMESRVQVFHPLSEIGSSAFFILFCKSSLFNMWSPFKSLASSGPQSAENSLSENSIVLRTLTSSV